MGKAKQSAFYAVRNGRAPGIYSSWSDCLDQVGGFSNAVFKKFNTQQEAEAYAGISHGTAPSTFGDDYGTVPPRTSANYGATSYKAGARRAYAPPKIGSGYGTAQSNAGSSYGTAQSNAGSSYGTAQSNAGSSYGTAQSNAGSSYGTAQSNAGSKYGTAQSIIGTCSGTTESIIGAGHGTAQVKRSASDSLSPPLKRHQSSAPQQARTTTKDTLPAKGPVTVYTDGSSFNNGKVGARAGYGVYWGRDHALNISERLAGRQTNQRAEIMAVHRAVQIARDHNVEELSICTDSMFTINAVTDWMPKWKKRDWKRSEGSEPQNLDLFKELDELLQSCPTKITWTHVSAHTGIDGNEQADQLAKEGARKSLE